MGTQNRVLRSGLTALVAAAVLFTALAVLVARPVSAVDDETVLATTSVDLDARRRAVRFSESNAGNLVADSLLYQARLLAPTYGANTPDVAIQESGAIGINDVIAAGPLTVGDTIALLPEEKYVGVVNDVPAARFKEILEIAVSRVDGLSGGAARFAQVAGFSFVYDPSRTAKKSRIREVRLDDGTYIVQDGVVVTSRTVNVATTDYIAGGAYTYPFLDLPFVSFGITSQQALQGFLMAGVSIDPLNYPEGGEGRIKLSDTLVGFQDPTTGIWSLGSSFYYGNPGDVAFAGDWDCDGSDTPGLFRPSDGFVYLRNSNTPGAADITFFAGNPDDVPLPGDFDGDGCDTVSLYRPPLQTIYIFNALGENGQGIGVAEKSYIFGNPGDVPFVGDFDGDGKATVGLHRASTGRVYWRDSLNTGPATTDFIWGNPGDIVFAGDWDGDDDDTVGLVRGNTFYWRNSNTAGLADGTAAWVGGTGLPVTGRFGD